jgi:hypothetical protein
MMGSGLFLNSRVLGGAQKWLTDDGLWDIFLNSRVLGGAQNG